MKMQKTYLAAFLAAASVLMSAVTVSAGSTDQQSMDLTVNKSAEYTMTIPRSQEVSLGAVNTEIGELSITGNIGTKQQVSVTVEKTDFVDEKDSANHFAFSLMHDGAAFAGAVWSSEQVRAETAAAYPLTVHIPTAAWSGVAAGNYKATITFTAELQDVQ